MKDSYAAQIVFSEEQKADLALATKLIKMLPAKQPDGNWTRCHELVRAFEPLFKERWHLVDGQYGGAEHSWLVWRGKGMIVLDLYAVGELPQVKLVDCGVLWRRNTYEPGARRRDIRKNVVEWLHGMLLDLTACDPTTNPILGATP